MKCPVCRRGEWEVEPNSEEIISDCATKDVGYVTICRECGLSTDVYNTREAALQAMMPKVDKGLIEKVWKLCGEYLREQHSTNIGLNPNGTHFNSDYIKQELEKYWHE